LSVIYYKALKALFSVVKPLSGGCVYCRYKWVLFRGCGTAYPSEIKANSIFFKNKR